MRHSCKLIYLSICFRYGKLVVPNVLLDNVAVPVVIVAVLACTSLVMFFFPEK